MARSLKRWWYVTHRWLGIALCLLFAMWFVSGVVMMYVGYPKLTVHERLAHLPPLQADAGFCLPSRRSTWPGSSSPCGSCGCLPAARATRSTSSPRQKGCTRGRALAR